MSLATNGAAADAMAAARITGSARAGRLRLSFHVSTSDQDADLAADVRRRHIAPSHPPALGRSAQRRGRRAQAQPGDERPARPDHAAESACHDQQRGALQQQAAPNGIGENLVSEEG